MTKPDPQRALMLAAFDALITQTLADRSELVPSIVARHLVQALESSGLATLASPTADRVTMTLLGTRATNQGGTAIALLRNWQSAARDTLATGART